MCKKIFLTLLTSIFIATTSLAQEKREKTPSPLKKSLKINLEAGGTFSKGNSREESIYSKNSLSYKKNKWTEIFKSRLENTEVNRARAKERYDINNQLRHEINKKFFKLLELEYIDDRFSGYDHRISETYGFGRKLIENEKMTLSSQLSTGLRQSRFTTGQNDYSWLVRTGIHYNWKINDSLTFDESFDLSLDQETAIIKSDSSIRITLDSLNHSLYLQLGYFIERRSSNPAPGSKRTDSTFMTMIGYNF